MNGFLLEKISCDQVLRINNKNTKKSKGEQKSEQQSKRSEQSEELQDHNFVIDGACLIECRRLCRFL